MNELLCVVVDLGLETLKNYHPLKLLGDIGMFLNCYALQSAKNTFRLYAAFPSSAVLLFPLEEDLNTHVKRMANGDIINQIKNRFEGTLSAAP
jgi:hypothetical protein